MKAVVAAAGYGKARLSCLRLRGSGTKATLNPRLTWVSLSENSNPVQDEKAVVDKEQ